MIDKSQKSGLYKPHFLPELFLNPNFFVDFLPLIITHQASDLLFEFSVLLNLHFVHYWLYLHCMLLLHDNHFHIDLFLLLNNPLNLITHFLILLTNLLYNLLISFIFGYQLSYLLRQILHAELLNLLLKLAVYHLQLLVLALERYNSMLMSLLQLRMCDL